MSDFGETINGLNHEKSMHRIFTMAKVHRALRTFTDNKEPQDQTTKRLLKGFYTKDSWELENDSEQEGNVFAAQANSGRIKDIVLNIVQSKSYVNFLQHNRSRKIDITGLKVSKRTQVMPNSSSRREGVIDTYETLR